MAIVTQSGPSAIAAMPADRLPEELTVGGGMAVRLHEVEVEGGAGALGDERACIVADDADGRRVGRVAYRRVYGPRAVLTLDVGEELWHSGLPAVLIVRICLRAARVGITTLLARVPARDMALLALLREDFAAYERRDGAHVDVELSTAVAAPSGWTTERDGRSSPMEHGAAPPRFTAMSTIASNFAAARVADVMHGPVITCGPETPIPVVARTMADEQVHAVVVTGIELTAWGVVTALDVAAAAATNATDDVARDVAATEPVTVNADTPLSEAARVMVEHQVNHLLVEDADGHPVGIVSTSDVARRFATVE